MEDIILKLSNMEIMINANEATCCEFISAILLFSGEDATGRVDYTIKSLKDLCGKPRNIKIGYAQNLRTNKKKQTADQAFGNDYFDYIYDGIYSTSSSEHQTNLTKSAVKENPELLQSNVKRINSIIVGLLKDRVSVDSSPASKRARIKKLIKNNMYPGLRPKPLYLFLYLYTVRGKTIFENGIRDWDT
ncbi:hypothetical protein C1646_817417 [Rhizophagus diaphanus]|nr:hypothetical protein C1646_817417 [Rhizophagus diaphanus] [Rhizophagus sp. MUCL 43196]